MRARGMTKRIMKKIIKSYYHEDSEKIEPGRRRFMIINLLCFLGVQRFGDISQTWCKNVEVWTDGRVKVWMEKSKSDKNKEGGKFVLTKRKVGKVSVTKLVEWYMKLLG